jgi:hypothetical protein
MGADRKLTEYLVRVKDQRLAIQIREFNSHAHELAGFKVESNHCIPGDAAFSGIYELSKSS